LKLNFSPQGFANGHRTSGQQYFLLCYQTLPVVDVWNKLFGFMRMDSILSANSKQLQCNGPFSKYIHNKICIFMTIDKILNSEH